MPTIETDTAHMRIGSWDCPFCEKDGRVVQPKERVKQAGHGALLSHIRGVSDDAHSGYRELPSEFERSDASQFLTVEQPAIGSV